MEQHTTEFAEAYGRATGKIMDAVLEFERETGHAVFQIELRNIDISTYANPGQTLRDAHIRWDMTASERALSPEWNDGEVWQGPSP